MRWKSLRRTSQVFFLLLSVLGIFGISMSGLIYPYFFCYACPFATAACPLGLMEHAAIDMVLIGVWEGLMLLAYTLGFLSIVGLIFGRTFCGWACPIGFLQDVITKIEKGRISKIVKDRIHLQNLDFEFSKLKYIKYLFIPFIPIASYLTLDLLYTRACPIGGITGTIPSLLFQQDKWVPGPDFPVKVISVSLFFVLVIVVGRGWCRFLCPIGGIFAPFNKVSGVTLERDDDCIHCDICADACPMGIEEPGEEREPECILCGRCADECPHSALELKFKWWWKDE